MTKVEKVRNPRTGRMIEIGGALYNKLKKQGVRLRKSAVPKSKSAKKSKPKKRVTPVHRRRARSPSRSRSSSHSRSSSRRHEATPVIIKSSSRRVPRKPRGEPLHGILKPRHPHVKFVVSPSHAKRKIFRDSSSRIRI
jgi:hypothetical protein